MYNDFESGTGDDDESGGISPTYENGVRSIGMQRRKNSVERNRNSINIKSEISSDLERSYGVKTAPAVARAVNCLDTWAQLTGRFVAFFVALAYLSITCILNFISCEQIFTGRPTYAPCLCVLPRVLAPLGIRGVSVSCPLFGGRRICSSWTPSVKYCHYSSTASFS